MSNVQGCLPPWGERELSDAQRKQAKAALSRCLGSDHISTRQGPRNIRIPYLDVSTTIRLANEAFRYDGWSSNIISVTQDFMKEERGAWSCCYTAMVRISLPNGCYHDGIGVGNAEHVYLQADAIEKAKKSAVSDAMKRALRCFGEGLGNSITSDSATSKGTVLSVYEDEFDAKDITNQVINISKDHVSIASNGTELNNSKRLHTTVSPISSGQLNSTTVFSTAHAAQRNTREDAFSINTEIDTIGDTVTSVCTSKADVNIIGTNANLQSNKTSDNRPSLFPSTTKKELIKQGSNQNGGKLFHTVASDNKQDKSLLSEPQLKQCQSIPGKTRQLLSTK